MGNQMTFEPNIIETSNWHQNVSNSTHYHTGRSVIFDLGSMSFPSAAGRFFLGQGQFSKIVNSCPILFKLCAQVCGSHMNVHVQFRNNQGETVDVTPVFQGNNLAYYKG